MAVVFSDIGSAWGLKKPFGAEEVAKAAQECVAAAKAAQEFAAAAQEFAAAAKAAAAKAAEEYASVAKAAEEYAAVAKAAEEMAVAIHCKHVYSSSPSAFKKESVKSAEECAEAAKVAEECAEAAKVAEEMVVAIPCKQLYSASPSAFEKESAKAAEECAEAAEEMAVAIPCKQLYSASPSAFEKESATSKVPYGGGGVVEVYPCLCYPKELLKKEDEIRNGPHYVPEAPSVFKVERRKIFMEWAKKHGKNYNRSLYEWRLRYKIWLNTKERIEQLCSKSGRTFSIELMTMTADQTQIEYKLGNRGIVKPAVLPLPDVKKRVLNTMGESWMEKWGIEFEKWADRHKKVYSSSEEREKRLLAYLNNMRVIDLWEKYYPCEWGFGNDLENMDQFPWEKVLVPGVECSRCMPCKQAPRQVAIKKNGCNAC